MVSDSAEVNSRLTSCVAPVEQNRTEGTVLVYTRSVYKLHTVLLSGSVLTPLLRLAAPAKPAHAELRRARHDAGRSQLRSGEDNERRGRRE